MAFLLAFMAHPYIRLMRLNRPTGIWLLLWPCWWAVTLSAAGRPPFVTLILFAVGAVLMRSAGCIVNDMIDRDIDAQVDRTRLRPLASGEVSMKQAFVLLGALGLAAFGIALTMNRLVLVLAVLSLVLVVTYPFMKRVTWWPQAFLGLTFNWGALMGWAAVRGTLEPAAFALYAAGFFWTLGYDTIYAHQDKKDDVRIGVKSTALLLGRASRFAVAQFYGLSWLGLLLAGGLSGASPGYYAGMIAAGFGMALQVIKVDFDSPASCLRVFCANSWLGAVIFIGMWLC